MLKDKKCKFSEPVFAGKYPKKHFKGIRIITGKVLKQYTSTEGYKSLQIQVIECSGHEPIEPGKRIVRGLKSLIKTIKFFE